MVRRDENPPTRGLESCIIETDARQRTDKIISLAGYGNQPITAIGVLYDAVPGNDHCNGNIAPIQSAKEGACLCDCLHLDDLLAILKEKGLDKRPPGK